MMAAGWPFSEILYALKAMAKTGVVRDVFAKRQFTVHVIPRYWLVRIILGHQRLCPGSKPLVVFPGEPTRRVEQLAVAIVPATLVVETVTDLVTDDCTDSTIVDGIICIHVEKRRMQDCCREHDLIQFGIVISVGRLRRHTPLFAVDGFAELGDISVVLENCGTYDITE